MQTEFNKTVGETIEAKRAELAEAITRRHFELKPELAVRYGERGRTKCLKDADYHLSYLAEAIAASRPELFTDYVAWAKVLLAGFGIGEEDLADNLRVMRAALEQYLSADESIVACQYVDRGLGQIVKSPSDVPSFINKSEPLWELADGYLKALLAGERHTASRLIHDALAAGGTDLKDIYIFVFQRTQHEIGRLWQMNQLSVAQEHYCTAATQMIMSQLYDHLFTNEKTGRRMIATCVEGDFHEIGARMVADFFEMEGWDTFYLGANVPTASLLKTVAERRADLIVISATMTFHVRAVRELIKAIRESVSTRHVKIMVGGYPFNIAPNLWKEIGADAFSKSALEAVAVAERLMENK